MSDRKNKILAAISDETKRATVSKETARAALIAEGIYDAEGKLTPEFGGLKIDPLTQITALKYLP